MRVLIAGGGLGGLALALCLHARGFEVRVFERAGALGEVGAGIQVSPNGARILHALGLKDALAAAAFRPEAVELRLHRSGLVVARTPLGAALEARYGAPYYQIHRADLLAILADAVRTRCGDVIETGRAVAATRGDARAGALIFEDGTEAEGDVIVGCDGVRSTVRASLFGPEAPTFTGHVAWRAVIPAERVRSAGLRPVVTSWMGPRSHAVTYFLRRGDLVNFVGVTERDWRAESWTEAGDPADLRGDFAGWHPTVTRLVEAIETPFRWALFARAPMTRWGEGRITLLGDACHPMLPYLAQGAVMAFEDAANLSAELSATAGDPAGALRRYEAARRPRTARVQAAARAQGRMFHLTSPANRLSVFGAAALVSRALPGVVADRNAWLWGHQAPLPL